MLIDMIGCIASLIGQDGMNDPAITPLYFPFIYQLFADVGDTDMRLYPIMECFVCVLPVIGMESQPYVVSIYKRFLHLLRKLFRYGIYHGYDNGYTVPPLLSCVYRCVSDYD